MCKKKRRIKERWFELGYKRCHYCCVQLNYSSGFPNSATVEHIVPKSQGGTLAFVNTLVVCDTCNTKRKAKSFLHYTSGSRLPRLDWLHLKYEQAKEYYSAM